MEGVLLSNSTRRTKRPDKPIDSNDPIIRRGHKARGTILLTAWPQHAPPHGGPLPSRRASAARCRAAALLSTHGVETHRSPPQPHPPDLGGAGTVGTNLPTPLLSVTVVSCAGASRQARRANGARTGSLLRRRGGELRATAHAARAPVRARHSGRRRDNSSDRSTLSTTAPPRTRGAAIRSSSGSRSARPGCICHHAHSNRAWVAARERAARLRQHARSFLLTSTSACAAVDSARRDERPAAATAA